MSKVSKSIILLVYILLVLLTVINIFKVDKFVMVDYRNKIDILDPNLENIYNHSLQNSIENYLEDSGKQTMWLVGTKSTYEQLVINKELIRNKAIIGENMMFFDTELPYFEKSLYSDDEILTYVNKLQTITNYYKSKGVEFRFMIAPNKSSVYPMYMPEIYNYEKDNFTSKLIQEYTINYKVEYIPLYEYVIEYAGRVDEPMYFTDDAHWNYKMGYIASKFIEKELGFENKHENYMENISLGKVSIASSEISRLTGLYGVFRTDMSNYVLANPIDVNTSKPILTVDNDNTEKIMFIRDSFFNQVIPVFLESQFDQVYYWLVKLDEENYIDVLQVEEDVNIVVFETVERLLIQRINDLYDLIITQYNKFEEVDQSILEEYELLDGFNSNISSSSYYKNNEMRIVGWGKVPGIDSELYESVIFLVGNDILYRLEGQNIYQTDVTEYFDDGTSYDYCRFDRVYTGNFNEESYEVKIGIIVNDKKYLIETGFILEYDNGEEN